MKRVLRDQWDAFDMTYGNSSVNLEPNHSLELYAFYTWFVKHWHSGYMHCVYQTGLQIPQNKIFLHTQIFQAVVLKTALSIFSDRISGFHSCLNPTSSPSLTGDGSWWEYISCGRGGVGFTVDQAFPFLAAFSMQVMYTWAGPRLVFCGFPTGNPKY